MQVVINGLTDEACLRTVSVYRGYETWLEELGSYGMSKVMSIGPSPHSGAEAKNLIALANEMEWKTLHILTSVNHLP